MVVGMKARVVKENLSWAQRMRTEYKDTYSIPIIKDKEGKTKPLSKATFAESIRNAYRTFASVRKVGALFGIGKSTVARIIATGPAKIGQTRTTREGVVIKMYTPKDTTITKVTKKLESLIDKTDYHRYIGKVIRIKYMPTSSFKRGLYIESAQFRTWEEAKQDVTKQIQEKIDKYNVTENTDDQTRIIKQQIQDELKGYLNEGETEEYYVENVSGIQLRRMDEIDQRSNI